MNYPERVRSTARLSQPVVELAYGVESAHQTSIVTDWRGEIAAVVPAAEYRRLQHMDEAHHGR